MPYLAAENRYDNMIYNRTGRSGLKLPAISLGWWYNFGGLDCPGERPAPSPGAPSTLGITHFDLANNYGPPPGSAEETFGLLMRQDFHPYRDELVISTKAGYDMWAGPYGEWGSRKYLLASLDASLKRMGLDYVDIFYHHRPDPDTPLEESHGRTGRGRPPGQGALRWHLELQSRADTASGQDPARAGNALPHPSAALQHAGPLDRGRPDWTSSWTRASAASSSRRWSKGSWRAAT